MEPFDIELAKAGHPVCTRDGRKVRIVCFNRKSSLYPIIALIENTPEDEELVIYPNTGVYDEPYESNEDLMMLPEKKEGWAIICKSDLYESQKIALEDIKRFKDFIKLVKVEWEE